MEDPYWSSLFLKDYTLPEGPTLEQFVKSCSPQEGLTLKFTENYLQCEGPHTGPGEECEEEGVAETMCDELTTIPIPHSSVPLGGRRERNQERSQAWEEGRGGGKEF